MLGFHGLGFRVFSGADRSSLASGTECQENGSLKACDL